MLAINLQAENNIARVKSGIVAFFGNRKEKSAAGVEILTIVDKWVAAIVALVSSFLR